MKKIIILAIVIIIAVVVGYKYMNNSKSTQITKDQAVQIATEQVKKQFGDKPWNAHQVLEENGVWTVRFDLPGGPTDIYPMVKIDNTGTILETKNEGGA